MSKKSKKRRSTFPEQSRRPAASAEVYREQWDADMPSPGIFGFFREIGVRETIESLLLAVLLALMFRAFECEAFIIPTGSMAPSLNGQHYDLECNNCDYRYHSGTTTEQNRHPDQPRDHSTYCPICQYPTKLSINRGKFPDHVSNNGDRILVNKFIYDFAEPERFDVIVFKNPNNGKQNYIKRLIGMPGDNLAIESGDIKLFDKDGDGWKKRIARKPAHKLKNTLQTVDDTFHIGDFLKKVDWPLRWQDYSGTDNWSVAEVGGHPVYKSDGSKNAWIRYRHFQPRKSEWRIIDEGLGDLPVRMKGEELPAGELITDQYSYNDLYHEGVGSRNAGFHWVGDIGVECDVKVESNQGQIVLDLVEGGVHFQCVIDVSDGTASLKTTSELDSKVEFVDGKGQAVAVPTASTSVGVGDHRLLFVNADDQLHLWVNGYQVDFEASTYIRKGVALPYFSDSDAGDAEPAGVGSLGAKLTVERLKIVRDIYYTSTQNKAFIENEARWTNYGEIYAFLQDPSMWSSERAKQYFAARKDLREPMFRLKKGESASEDQFLPMGDNSPNSLDGRFWTGRHYVQRDMLIGRAAFVFWPHTVNKPFPLFPNFWEMGFIK
jgi:signal peptidase I